MIFQQVCLALAAQIAILTLLAGVFQPIAQMFSINCSMESKLFGLAALFCTAGLYVSDEAHARMHLRICRLLAILTGLIGTFAAASGSVGHLTRRSAITGSGIGLPGGDSLVRWEAAGFILLAAILLLPPSQKPLLRKTADGITWLLCFVTLSAVSQGMYLVVFLHNLPPSLRASIAGLACLIPLTVVAGARQTRHGVFSILLGHGIGGKIARIIGPAIMLIHFVREYAVARLLLAHMLPFTPTLSVLIALGTSIMFVLLLFLVWRINRMEQQIHDLSLRDELTQLYNLRGFNLLADQAMRLASRSGMPFSVLFIDLDNLKLINDRFGHNAGSKALTETARLLMTTFRESDILGRVGGDEFIVAGPFTAKACHRAIGRLRQHASLHNAREGQRFPLTFSVGTATSQDTPHPPLRILVKKADEAMYEEKRARKAVAEMEDSSRAMASIAKHNPMQTTNPHPLSQSPRARFQRSSMPPEPL